MTKEFDLLASYWTISGGALPHTDREYSPFDFKDRVESIANAGFKGMGIWHADLEHILERRSLREMKQILDDNGITTIELEFLTDWFLEGERKKKSDVQMRKLLQAAEALEADHIKVGDFYHQPYSITQVTNAFAALCSEAVNHGTKIGFELMPFAMIDSLKDSLAMVEGAGAANGGIVFDLWHLVKLHIPYEEVQQVPRKWIVGVELNDGTFTAPWSMHEDTVNHRRLCGEGDFDVKGFVQAVRKTGYAGPWGIEVLSEEVRKLPLEEVAKRAFKTTIDHVRI
jgi:sugar phosphate isomerase/epimerase